MGFRQLTIYGSGQNLWTKTNYSGRDPEVNTDFGDFFTSGNIASGLDFFTPPQAKTMVFGVKVGF